LGTTKQPVNLIFIKLLLDRNLHQGLFNMVAVLSNRFYVVNDIDGDDTPIAIELLNDQSTKFQWKINIIDSKLIK